MRATAVGTEPQRKSVTIKYKRTPKQREFHDAVLTHYITGFRSGRGGGKTYAGAQEAIRHALVLMPGSKGGIVAPTFRMLHDFAQRAFLDFLPPELIKDFNRSDDKMLITTPEGKVSEVYFRSADDPDKVRGGNWDWMWGDEMTLWKFESFQTALGCLRGSGSVPRDQVRGWFTFTPNGPGQVKKAFETEDSICIGATSMDNPNLTERFLAMLRSQYSGPFYDQEVLGLWIKFEGLIYQMLTDATHLVERRVQDMQCFEAAVDWGFDHPWVFGVAGFDGDERGHLFDALHKRGLTLDDQIPLVSDMLKRYPIQTIYCPDDRPDNIKSYQNAGFPVTVVKREVISGIQTVSAALAIREDGRPGFTFSATTQPVYSEMLTYQWKIKPEDKPDKEEPLKVKDDGPDMVRYLLHGRKQAQGSAPGIEILFSEDD